MDERQMEPMEPPVESEREMVVRRLAELEENQRILREEFAEQIAGLQAVGDRIADQGRQIHELRAVLAEPTAPPAGEPPAPEAAEEPAPAPPTDDPNAAEIAYIKSQIQLARRREERDRQLLETYELYKNRRYAQNPISPGQFAAQKRQHERDLGELENLEERLAVLTATRT